MSKSSWLVRFLVGGAALVVGRGAPAAAPPAATPVKAPAPASAAVPAPRPAAAAARAPLAAPVKVTTVEGITEYRLANGLQLLLFPDKSKPTVTVNVTYLVGSRHEGYGETGMAHLLEHMLFKGTPAHPDVWKLLQDRGANFNGSTWYDRTNYYEELPASPDNLTFALRLEADRMINSRIAAEDLAKEFSVVRNEFELGESNPISVLEEKMFSAAYQWHNYGKSSIGSRTDIERVPVENLRAFYRRFYQPDNAVVVVAGKFDEQQALSLVNASFGVIPRPARKLSPTWTEEPVQDGERQVTLRRTGDVAAVAVMYHTVAGADPDWVATDALVDVLTSKPAGRLYKALVEKGLAGEVFGTVYPTAEPGALYIGAKVRKGGSPDKVRDVLVKVVEEVASRPVTDAEVERWRARALREFELQMTETATVGVALSEWAAMGDWRLAFLNRDRTKALKAADVARVAKSYVVPSNRTLGMFVPTAAPARAPAPPRVDVAALMKDFKGSAAPPAGEEFVANEDSVEGRIQRTVLASGAKLGMLPKKTKGGAVRLSVVIRYGSEKDLTGKTHAAYILPQVMMRGSKKHGFQQLKDEFDRLKAEVSCNSGRSVGANPGTALCRIKTTRENLPGAVSLLAEVLRAPAFVSAEFETLRKEALSRLEEQLQDPNANGMNALLQRITPLPPTDVRHRASIRERIDELKKMKLGDVMRLHHSLWGSSAAQIAVVGDFDPAETKALLDKELGQWKSPRPYTRIDQPFKEGLAEEAVINTPDKQSSFVAVGHPIAMRDDDPEYPALVLLNHMLGGSTTSRLFLRLRQKEGLSYGAFSDIDARPLDKNGSFFAAAMCAPQNADKALALLLEEIEVIRKSGFSDKELADAKKSYAAGWESQMAEDDFIAGELVNGLFLDRTFAYWKKLNDRLQKVTAAELQAAAQKYLRPEKLAKVKAGDLAKKAS
jgi:zinc protease